MTYPTVAMWHHESRWRGPGNPDPARRQPRDRIDGVIIHDSEQAEDPNQYDDAEQLATAMQKPGTSGYGAIADIDRIIETAPDQARTNSAPPTNGTFLHICIPERVTYGREQWLAEPVRGHLRVVAVYIVEKSRLYGFPLTRITPEQMRAGAKGYADHWTVTRAWGQTSHTDVGTNFPWDVLADEITKAAAGTPILGPSLANLDQGLAYASTLLAVDEALVAEVFPLFWELGPQRGGVRPEVAAAQSLLETTGFTFPRCGITVCADYHNTCGMRTKSIPKGEGELPTNHQRFASWREGVTAHLDHLALYAGAPSYPRADTPDPRHFAYLAGLAPTVEQLSGRWAPSSTYGAAVKRHLDGIMATPQEDDDVTPAEHEAILRKVLNEATGFGLPDWAHTVAETLSVGQRNFNEIQALKDEIAALRAELAE